MSEENRGVQEQSPEARQTDIYNKDVGETGRWGSRSKREIIVVVVLVTMIIAGTVCAVVFTREDKPREQEPVNFEGPIGESYIDEETGLRVSAYQLPVPPATQISDADELAFVRDILLTNYTGNYTGYEAIPAAIESLVGKADDTKADPVVRAASWLVTVDQTNVQEHALTRFALAVIYYTTGGAGWKNNSEWLSAANHCDWYGVACCQDVPASRFCAEFDSLNLVEIDLYDNNLVGTIPHSFEVLTDLQSLFLNENWLTGEIPATAFGLLPKFQKLYLSNNKLSGKIPPGLHTNDIFGKCYTRQVV